MGARFWCLIGMMVFGAVFAAFQPSGMSDAVAVGLLIVIGLIVGFFADGEAKREDKLALDKHELETRMRLESEKK